MMYVRPLIPWRPASPAAANNCSTTESNLVLTQELLELRSGSFSKMKRLSHIYSSEFRHLACLRVFMYFDACEVCATR
jgi:hypothetical protein